MKPGLITPEQLRAIAPVPKVLAGLLAFAVLQLLAHLGVDLEAVGLSQETVVAIVVFAVMYLRRDRRRRRRVDQVPELPPGRERIGA